MRYPHTSEARGFGWLRESTRGVGVCRLPKRTEYFGPKPEYRCALIVSRKKSRLALHREFDGTRSAVKTVVALTGANERAVKNWFEARNAPSAEFLIELCRHSDEVLSTFLLLAGRREQVKARKLAETREKLRDLLDVLATLDEP